MTDLCLCSYVCQYCAILCRLQSFHGIVKLIVNAPFLTRCVSLVTAKLSVILLWLSEMLCEVINFGELNLCVMITGKPELPYNMQRVSALLIKFDRANLFLVRHVLL